MHNLMIDAKEPISGNVDAQKQGTDSGEGFFLVSFHDSRAEVWPDAAVRK